MGGFIPVIISYLMASGSGWGVLRSFRGKLGAGWGNKSLGSCFVVTSRDSGIKKNHGKIWVLPKIGVPQNAWVIMETPIKMDD